MSEEYIEEGINGQWTDWKFEAENYKKIYEHLQQENQQLKEKVGELTQSLNEQMKLTNEENLDCSKYAIENQQLKEEMAEIVKYKELESCSTATQYMAKANVYKVYDTHIKKLKETNDKLYQQLDLYKEVIEEVWNFIKSYPGISQSGVMTIKAILHKVKGELENE